ncbi:DUF4249 domain-containing protein [Hymenobacter latericus]|uniref:DUF4249 domain-containing protein n=1 Tax=Hymenobacter sp. YIM 151858-1 TaxID=2987688 RepID=UPI002227956A|nr:DUF4249 domain-containing protein [Hymenobacter sp. YIM 151858-1]UYZ58776.1 DUF4249 domain-containing protein [Hymenobacter sp. YIM 151858-1]
MLARFISFAALALTLGTLASCTDVVPIDLPEPESQLAVEGNITDQPGPYEIRLTRTGAYFDDKTPLAVRGAELTISDSQGTTETLRETEPGVYQTSTLRGRIGNQYTLTIKADGQEYRAATEIKRVPEIDRFEQQHKVNEPGWRDGYYVLYNGPELPGVGDYYRFKLYQNDTLRNNPDELIVRDDALVDGKYIGDVELTDRPFRIGDRVRVEILSLPKDYFFFLNEMFTQINNVGMFSSPPANVRTNIINVDPKGPKAVGYFAGTAVRSASLTITP